MIWGYHYFWKHPNVSPLQIVGRKKSAKMMAPISSSRPYVINEVKLDFRGFLHQVTVHSGGFFTGEVS